MKFDWRDWRVILGAGIVVLLVIGSYFGWRYQSSDARLNSLSPVASVPSPPPDTHTTVHAPQPGSETVTEVTDAVGTSEVDAVEIHESLVQLRDKKAKVEAEIDKITHLRNETSRQRGREHERILTEMLPKRKMVEKEAHQLAKIIGEKVSLKLGPNPTPEEVESEVQSFEEWHQLGKLLRETDTLAATLAAEETYEQKMKEIEQKKDKLFEEWSAITGRIEDLASQLAVE